MATTTTPMGTRTSSKGTAALVFGILSIVFAVFFFPLGFLMGAVAVILGVMGRRESANEDGKATGGLVTGLIGLVMAAAFGVFIGVFLAQNADTIRDCSKEPTQAAQEACIETRLQE